MIRTLAAAAAAASLMAAPLLAQTQQAPAEKAEAAEPPPPAIDKAPPDKIAPPGPIRPEKDRDAAAGEPPKSAPESAPETDPKREDRDAGEGVDKGEPMPPRE